VSTFRAAHTTFVVCDTPKTVDVSLRGEYDLSSTDTSELVIELVADLLVKTPRPVILDLSAVSFFDAAGIKFLLRVHRVAQLAGTTARVHNPTADVRRLFELVGLSTFIDGTSQRQ
jgi:anti-anti-sigma factor